MFYFNSLIFQSLTLSTKFLSVKKISTENFKLPPPRISNRSMS